MKLLPFLCLDKTAECNFQLTRCCPLVVTVMLAFVIPEPTIPETRWLFHGQNTQTQTQHCCLHHQMWCKLCCPYIHMFISTLSGKWHRKSSLTSSELWESSREHKPFSNLECESMMKGLGGVGYWCVNRFHWVSPAIRSITFVARVQGASPSAGTLGCWNLFRKIKKNGSFNTNVCVYLL